MRNKLEAGPFGDLLELAVSLVLEEGIPAARRRDVQILVTVVVVVAECAAYADSVP